MITALLFIGGLVALVLGAQLLVKSSSTLAIHFGIPAIIIGVTIVAFATSAPEVAVSVDAVISNSSNIALGNVLGSNIANVLLIFGISALVSPISINRSIIRKEVPIMIISGVIVYLMALDGALQPLDGAILLLLFTGFSVYQIYQAKKETGAGSVEGEQVIREANPWLQGALLVLGLGLLIVGARLLVKSAVDIAEFWGISELIIGLTVIAIGTSLPEIATSVIASFEGKADLSVGNVVGSNIFNLLLVLGISSFFSADGIAVSSAALALDFPLMLAVFVACLPIFFTDFEISRWEGALFLAYYLAYMAYLILDTSYHKYLSIFSEIMLIFVAPITVITLLVLAWQFWKRNNETGENDFPRNGNFDK